MQRMVRTKMIMAKTAAIPTNTYTHKLRESRPGGGGVEIVDAVSAERRLLVVGDVASTEDVTEGEEVE